MTSPTEITPNVVVSNQNTRRRTGVAQILGLRFSGFVAWWLWRSIYLAKLPRLEKKLRVMLDWTLDLVFSRDLVQFTTSRSSTPARGDAIAAD